MQLSVTSKTRKEANLMKNRVLVVDDEKLVRWSVGQALSESNCEVELASSGEEAVEKANQVKFDMVVTDLKMDGINGVQTIREIKKVIPGIKAVMITAYGTEKDAWEARNEGISLWMAKPFQMSELTRFIQGLLTENVQEQVVNPPQSSSFNPHISKLLSFVAIILALQFSLVNFTLAQNFKSTRVSLDSKSGSVSKDAYSVEYLYSIKDGGTKYDRLLTLSNMYFDSRFKELYVVDLGANRVLSFDTNGMPRQNMKNFGKVKNPVSVTQDSQGNIYIADVAQPLIVVLNYFGAVKGYLDLSSLDTTSKESIRIKKIVMDNKDRLLVAENKGNRIFVLDSLDGKLLHQYGGAEDKEVHFKAITDMILDDHDNLLVLDSGKNQVMILNPEGQLIRSFGKSGSSPYTLGLASGLTWDNDRKWIIVTDSARHEVLFFDQYGECFFEFGGLGRGIGYFYFPRGAAIDSNQRIYILEPDVARIQVFQIHSNPSPKEEKAS